MKVLIVDDEPTIQETLDLRLRRDGFSTFTASTAEEGMRLYRLVKPDIILLDIMLPNRSGIDLCKAVRKDSQTPIIFISARAAEEDRILGLEMGADDYITKPFHLSEVSARVKAVLRRGQPETPTEKARCGDIVVDPKRHEAFLGEKKLELTPREFGLLYFLASHPDQVFSRDALLDRVWGKDAYVSSRTVDVHICWLRKHIEEDADHPRRLITLRGVGYKLNS